MSESSAVGSGIHRDDVVIGLVSMRQVLSDGHDPDIARRVVREMMASVLQPMIEMATDDPQRASLIDALASVISDDELDRIWNLPGIAEEAQLTLLGVLEALLEHSALPVESAAPLTGEFDAIVEQPDGRCTVVRVMVDGGGKDTHRPLVDSTDRIHVEGALNGVLADFPSLRAEAVLSRAFTTAWPTDVPLVAPECTLTIAVWCLGALAGLPVPECLVAGEVNGAACQRLRGASLSARLAAAEKRRRALFALTDAGWSLFAADGTSSTYAEPPTLDGAATLLWGEKWTDWRRQRHRAEFEAAGWRVVDHAATARSAIADLDTMQSKQLVRHFTGATPAGQSVSDSVAVISGTARTGKSTAVRRMADELAKRKKPWTVIVIERPGDPQLPDKYEAVEIAGHATKMLEDVKDRRLVVFENLKPIDRTNVNEVLQRVRSECDVSVLGVLEMYDASPSDWTVDGLKRIVSVVGDDARQEFIRTVSDSQPDVTPEMIRAAQDSRIDLRRVTQILIGATPEASVAERFATLPNDQRDPLTRAAAISLLRGRVDAESLATLEEADKDLFGVTVSEDSAHAYLSGLSDCLQLIDLSAAERTGRPAGKGSSRVRRRKEIAALVEPLLTEAIQTNHPRAASILVGSRQYDIELCDELVGRDGIGNSLADWASGTSIESLMRVLVLKDVLTETLTEQLIGVLVERVRVDQGSWHPRELRFLVDKLLTNAHAMTDEVADELILWLIHQTEAVLQLRKGQSEERFLLVERLARVDDSRTRELLERCLLDVLYGLRVDSVESYRLVRKVRKLQVLLEHRTDNVFRPGDPIDQEPGVQELLNYVPTTQDDFAVVIESFCLRIEFAVRDFDLVARTHRTPAIGSLAGADPRSVADALQSFRSTSPQYAAYFLTKFKDDLLPGLGAVLWRANSLDAAVLLDAVRRTSVEVAWRLLTGQKTHYSSAELLRAFTNKIKGQVDASYDPVATSMLLRTTHLIGDLYYVDDAPFSTNLAHEVGFAAMQRMLKDPRMSACYELVSAIWDVGADFRGLILDQAVQRAIDSINSTRKHWGPELALRLCRDDEYGEYVMDRLRKELAPERVLALMWYSRTDQGRTASHRLGRALFPGIPAEYSKRWQGHAFADNLSTQSAQGVLGVCAEVAHTLRDADIPGAGQIVIDETGGVEGWARRLSSSRNGSHFAAILRSLARSDAQRARDVVVVMRSKQSRLQVNGSTVDRLAARVRGAMLEDAGTTARVVGALHTVDADLTRQVMADVYRDEYATYVFNGFIAQEQNPIEQAQAAMALTKAGMRPGTSEGKWMNKVYETRLATAHAFTNPLAAESLVRMASMWRSEWGAALAGNLQIKRIAARVGHGRKNDVAPAVDLMRTLCAIEQPTLADEVLDSLLKNHLPGLIGGTSLTTACRLIDVMHALRPHVARTAIPHLQKRITEVVQSCAYMDERKFWLELGYATCVLRSYSDVVTIEFAARDPWVAPNTAHSPVIALVATHLGDAQWGDCALERATERLRTWSFENSLDAACVLLAGAQGFPAEVVERAASVDLDNLGLQWVRLLCGNRQSPIIKRRLSASSEVMWTRVDSDYNRPNWDAYKLKLIRSGIEFEAASAKGVDEV